MDALAGLVWFSLALFMVHEFEEIILIKAWAVRRRERIASLWPRVKPFGLHLFDEEGYASAPITETASIGIGMQFALIGLLTLLSVLFGNYLVWFGIMLPMPLLSLLRHVLVTVRFKGYTPGIVSAVLTTAPILWILWRVYDQSDFRVWEIVIATVAANLVFGFFAMRYMHRTATALSRRLQRYAQGGKA